MKNCIGILKIPLKIKPSLISFTDLPEIYLWTWLWSVPKYDRAKNNPPVIPLQKVYLLFGSIEKSSILNFSLDLEYSKNLETVKFSGYFSIKKKKTKNRPKKITNICCFWVILTAFVPPVTVYTITKNPTKKFKIFRSIPRTVERIIDGAKFVIPYAKPLWIKNKIAPNVLVFLSNLFSKNSYAV